MGKFIGFAMNGLLLFEYGLRALCEGVKRQEKRDFLTDEHGNFIKDEKGGLILKSKGCWRKDI